MHIFYSKHICTLKFVSYESMSTSLYKPFDLFYLNIYLEDMFPKITETSKTLPLSMQRSLCLPLFDLQYSHIQLILMELFSLFIYP